MERETIVSENQVLLLRRQHDRRALSWGVVIGLVIAAWGYCLLWCASHGFAVGRATVSWNSLPGSFLLWCCSNYRDSRQMSNLLGALSAAGETALTDKLKGEIVRDVFRNITTRNSSLKTIVNSLFLSKASRIKPPASSDDEGF